VGRQELKSKEGVGIVKLVFGALCMGIERRLGRAHRRTCFAVSEGPRKDN